MVTFIKVMWWVYLGIHILNIPLSLFVDGYFEKNTKNTIGEIVGNGLALVFLFAIRPYLPF